MFILTYKTVKFIILFSEDQICPLCERKLFTNGKTKFILLLLMESILHVSVYWINCTTNLGP